MNKPDKFKLPYGDDEDYAYLASDMDAYLNEFCDNFSDVLESILDRNQIVQRFRIEHKDDLPTEEMLKLLIRHLESLVEELRH